MNDNIIELRAQAEKCRRLARDVDDSIARAALEELANDLVRRAEQVHLAANDG